MKNLITGIACVVVLLVFVLQFGASQATHNHMTLVEKNVNAFKEVAKQEGQITTDNTEALKTALSTILECGKNEIVVGGTTELTPRGEKLHYTVSVPLDDIIAASSFWGITNAENNATYTIDSYTTSEYVPR